MECHALLGALFWSQHLCDIFLVNWKVHFQHWFPVGMWWRAGHLTLKPMEVLAIAEHLPLVPSDEGNHLFSTQGTRRRVSRQQPKGRSSLTIDWEVVFTLTDVYWAINPTGWCGSSKKEDVRSLFHRGLPLQKHKVQSSKMAGGRDPPAHLTSCDPQWQIGPVYGVRPSFASPRSLSPGSAMISVLQPSPPPSQGLLAGNLEAAPRLARLGHRQGHGRVRRLPVSALSPLPWCSLDITLFDTLLSVTEILSLLSSSDFFCICLVTQWDCKCLGARGHIIFSCNMSFPRPQTHWQQKNEISPPLACIVLTSPSLPSQLL